MGSRCAWASPTPQHLERDEANRKRRAGIRVAAQRLIREDGLPMKVTGVDWVDVGHESAATAIIYFTAPGRVDFRQLVRDLSLTLDCKVVLTQLGARDKARVQGGSARAAARPAARRSSSTSSR